MIGTLYCLIIIMSAINYYHIQTQYRRYVFENTKEEAQYVYLTTDP